MSPLLLLLIAQPAQAPIDLTLPEDLRAFAKSVVEAELDPKRGSGNAVEMLKAEREKYKDQQHQLAIDLRMAAVVLRRRFLTVERFPVPIRWEQAVSTFSRLELTEPGLDRWIEETLKNHEYARKRIGDQKQRKIKAAILTRAGLDKQLLSKPLAEMLRSAGFELALVPAKEATMVLTLSADDAPPQQNLRMVRVQIGVESIREGKVVWRQGMYRVEGGVDADEAIGRAVVWLAKVAGRDLLFRWLGETAFHSLLEGGPQGSHGPHDGHAGEGPRGFAPQGEKK